MKKPCFPVRFQVILVSVWLLLFGLVAKSFSQANPPAWNANSSYLVGDLAQYAGETYRAITAMPPGRVQVPANPNYWEMHEVRVPILLNVGTDQMLPNLTVAWKYILNAQVDGSSGLTLNLISNETLSSSFNLDHPSGSNIALSSSNSASITFSNTAANKMGFTLDNSHVFGGIYSLVINGSRETSGSPSVGVLVSSGGNLSLAGTTINNFDIGIEAQDNATIIIGSKVAAGNFDFAAVYSLNHSLIDIQSPMTINGSLTLTTQSKFGFYASSGATLEANSCGSSYCQACFSADKGAHLDANMAAAENFPAYGSVGFLANSGGTIEATNSTVYQCRIGYSSEYKSFINASNCNCANIEGSTDFQASFGSMINAAGQTGGVTFSTPKNTLSADGSFIAD